MSYINKFLDVTKFCKGELPFRYLVIPLSTKRLSLIQCEPLVEKIMGIITSWTCKFLFYTGKIELLQKCVVCYINILVPSVHFT